MSETFLITGAAGFIGSHLARSLLADGHTVVGVDNFDPFYDRGIKEANLAETRDRAQRPDQFRLIECDIRDAAMIHAVESAAPDVIFHMAALAGVRPSIAEPQRYVSVNLDGLGQVLEAARGAGCRRMVFASSSSVYGNNEKVPFAETDSVDEPISPYAATKRAGELCCHTYSHLFDMRIASARLFTVYGPSQRPDLAISRFMKIIADGETVPMFGDGTTSRDYTFVADIVAGLRAAAEWTDQQPAGRCRIFNFGGSSPISLADLIATIGDVVGRTPKVEQLPMQPGDVNRTFADLKRSSAELGYRPSIALADGLAEQWAWLKLQTSGSLH